MFGKSKLLRDGRHAKAVVIGLGSGSQQGAAFRVHLRVTFEDGLQVDIWQRVGNHPDLPYLAEGDIVPVRYDPADRNRIELDIPALRSASKAKAEADRDAAISGAQEELGNPPDSPAS